MPNNSLTLPSYGLMHKLKTGEKYMLHTQRNIYAEFKF